MNAITEAKKKLRSMGFGNTTVYVDQPGEKIGVHAHGRDQMGIVVRGYLTLSTYEGSLLDKVWISGNYRPGQTFMVPHSIMHSVDIGDKQCEYVVGEK